MAPRSASMSSPSMARARAGTVFVDSDILFLPFEYEYPNFSMNV
jgi:hypothetical protein